jgi:hypothetical protein
MIILEDEGRSPNEFIDKIYSKIDEINKEIVLNQS